jgi:hypothetical protein
MRGALKGVSGALMDRDAFGVSRPVSTGGTPVSERRGS